MIKDHGVVVAFRSKPMNSRHTNTTSEPLIDLDFILELRMLCIDPLKLDSDILLWNNIKSKINNACSRHLWAICEKMDYRWHVPNDPEPIFSLTLYFPPTLTTSSNLEDIKWRVYYLGRCWFRYDETVSLLTYRIPMYTFKVKLR